MSALRNQKYACLSIGLCLAIICIAPFIGTSMKWTINELIFEEGIAGDIFWRVRVPRVLLGLLAGAALGTAGVIFQALFRNPLASPYTLGVASGASFGTAAAIVLGYTGSFLGLYGITIGGILGALLVTLVVYLLASKSSSGTHMLLAGVAMSFFFSSLLLLTQYLSNFTESFQIVRWLMGGLETTGYYSVVCLTPFVLFGVLLLFLYSRELDAILSGDELAYSRGVSVSGVKKKLFFYTSLMVGAVVSFTGPIGFVGIMVPHFCKLIVGASHKVLAPYTVLASASFLVACDSIARFIIAPADLPVGILTSLLGGPFFLWILLKKN